MRECDFRKVDDSAGDMVDVVAENVQRDMGHRFNDLAVGQPRPTCLVEARRPQLAPLHHNAVRELEDGIDSRIGGIGLSRLGEVLLGQPQLAADKRVRTKAICALIRLGDRERDLFTNLRAEASIRKGGAEIEVTFERSGRIAQYSNQVRHDAQFSLDAIEENLGLASGGLRIQLCNAVHDASLG